VRNILEEENLTIRYEDSGRPYVSNGVHISISHSYMWLAILFSRVKSDIGIDIEKVTDKVLRIRHKFLSVTELEDLQSASSLLHTVYWCAKEALYKACQIKGLHFAGNIYIEPFLISSQEGDITAYIILDHARKKVLLKYKIMGEYVLVYTCE
jgi:4'-phosphopantetheinyl transferase